MAEVRCGTCGEYYDPIWLERECPHEPRGGEFKEMREMVEQLGEVAAWARKAGCVMLEMMAKDHAYALTKSALAMGRAADKASERAKAEQAAHPPARAEDGDADCGHVTYKDGEQCPGCMKNITRPCEVCGRVQAKGKVTLPVKKTPAGTWKPDDEPAKDDATDFSLHPDGYPGTDEGSHYTAQEAAKIPPTDTVLKFTFDGVLRNGAGPLPGEATMADVASVGMLPGMWVKIGKYVGIIVRAESHRSGINKRYDTLTVWVNTTMMCPSWVLVRVVDEAKVKVFKEDHADANIIRVLAYGNELPMKTETSSPSPAGKIATAWKVAYTPREDVMAMQEEAERKIRDADRKPNESTVEFEQRTRDILELAMEISKRTAPMGDNPGLPVVYDLATRVAAAINEVRQAHGQAVKDEVNRIINEWLHLYAAQQKQREDIVAMAYKLARHVRNTDEESEHAWGRYACKLLMELRELDRVSYDRHVKKGMPRVKEDKLDKLWSVTMRLVRNVLAFKMLSPTTEPEWQVAASIVLKQLRELDPERYDALLR